MLEDENKTPVEENIPETEIVENTDTQVDKVNNKFDIPWLGIIVLGVIVVLIAVVIILLYAFGGPLPKA